MKQVTVLGVFLSIFLMCGVLNVQAHSHTVEVKVSVSASQVGNKGQLDSLQWDRSDSRVVNHGFVNGYCYLHFSGVKDSLVYIQNSLVREVSLLSATEGGGAIKREMVEATLGGFLLHSTTHQLILEIYSEDYLILPISVNSAANTFSDSFPFGLWWIYTGVAILALLMGLSMWLAIRNEVYLYYAFFVLSIWLGQSLLFGFGRMFLYSRSEYFCGHDVGILVGLTTVASLLFVRSFLPREILGRTLSMLVNCLFWVSVLVTTFGIVLCNHEIRQFIGVYSGVIASFIMFLSLVYLARSRSLRSALFAVGWFLFLIGSTVFSLKDLGLLDYNSFTAYSMTIGAGFECGVFLFVLSNEVGRIRSEFSATNDVVLHLNQEISNLEREFEYTQLKYSDERSKRLRSLLTPHFLFNGLATMQSYVFEGDSVAGFNFIAKYGKLLRISMEACSKTLVELKVELEIVERYLQLESLRDGFDLSWDIYVSEVNCNDEFFPSMTIQPIVENAIKHGLIPLKRGAPRCEVRVRRMESGGVLVEVEDNGIGIRKASANRDPGHKSLFGELIQERAEILRKTGQGELRLEIISRDGGDCEKQGVLTRISFLPYTQYQ